MRKPAFRSRKLLFLLFPALVLKLFSLNESWVERYYTYGLYPYIAKSLRFLLGWVPFSIGDLLYTGAAFFLLYQFVRFVRGLRRDGTNILPRAGYRVALISLWVYLTFNLLWGLNYNRKGIAEQLGLNVARYEVADLQLAATCLLGRLNEQAALVNEEARQELDHNRTLFAKGITAYRNIQQQYPFLAYSVPSVKPSLFSFIGRYIGFTGYYNPFTAEAQLRTKVPSFLLPFVVNHEIAHQLGYAKENEANFVSYLTGRQAPDAEVRYSVYFELYLYVAGELARKDSLSVLRLKEQLHPQVTKDYRAFLDYLERNRNPVEPYVSEFYDAYLRWNNQPKGKETYNEVVAWLIAYLKKYGPDAV